MNQRIIRIPNIHCHYCIITLKSELCKLQGVQDVKVDITTRQARIRWQEPATWGKIVDRLAEIGYPPQE